MEKNCKYILWDLDGTLTDPMIGITTCVQYALRHLGIEVKDLQELCPFIGPPLLDSFQEFYRLSEAQAQEAILKHPRIYLVLRLWAGLKTRYIRGCLSCWIVCVRRERL